MTIDFRQKPKQADAVPLTALHGRVGKEVIYATHNLCDETTWYSESARVVDEALPETDGLTYQSANICWTDMVNGKVFDEDGLIEDQKTFEPGDPHGYAIIVKSDGVEMTPRAPFAASGGDYVIDYALGTITFAATQAGKSVTASYSHKNGAGWIMKPLAGKALVIEKAEIQFSADINMNATFTMEVYGFADIFAPFLVNTFDPPGPLPPGTPIAIETSKYKSLDQIVDEAVAAFPEIPAMGGDRGFAQARHVFQFHYAAVRTLWSSLGMHVRVFVEGGSSFGGERATATFYCTSRVDEGVAEALKILTAE